MTATQKSIRIVRPTASTSSTLRLDTGEVAHVGVDVHKASYHVAVVTDLRGLVASWTQPADPELLVERLKPISKEVARVVYEAGPGLAVLERMTTLNEIPARVIPAGAEDWQAAARGAIDELLAHTPPTTTPPRTADTGLPARRRQAVTVAQARPLRYPGRPFSRRTEEPPCPSCPIAGFAAWRPNRA